MIRFKRGLAAVAISALLASSASAADVTPLPAGKPAGTHQAALFGNTVLLIGLAAVAVVIAIAVSGNDDNNPTTPTTSTTTTGTGA